MFARAYAAQRARITAQLQADPQAAIDWAAEPARLTADVQPLYAETAAAAARQARDQLTVSTDWGQSNDAVRALAETEARRFGQQATATSQAHVREVIADWIAHGGTMADLVGEVAAVWPGARPDVAAATEVTRLYATGNATAWEASGLVRAMTWRTTNDERVCPVCGPLADTEVAFGGALPPAHPGCRCWVVPIVEENDD